MLTGQCYVFKRKTVAVTSVMHRTVAEMSYDFSKRKFKNRYNIKNCEGKCQRVNFMT